MSDNVKTSLAVVRDRKDRLLEPVPVGAAAAAAEETRAELEQLLVELTAIAGAQDVERFDRGVAMALDATSRLRVYQAPGLPFDVPRKYDALPRLAGRAVVDLTVRKAVGNSFGFVNGDETNTATLRVVVDGYNAPITAGNFVENVRRGAYNGVSLKKSETALLAPARAGKVDPSATLPLEVKPLDDYEPRVPLAAERDGRGGAPHAAAQRERESGHGARRRGRHQQRLAVFHLPVRQAQRRFGGFGVRGGRVLGVRVRRAGRGGGLPEPARHRGHHRQGEGGIGG
jgi:hypothetical protein